MLQVAIGRKRTRCQPMLRHLVWDLLDRGKLAFEACKLVNIMDLIYHISLSSIARLSALIA
jgi:hypothetical protein